MAAKRIQIATYIAADVAEELEKIAERQDRSLASLLRIALYELIEREQAGEPEEEAVA